MESKVCKKEREAEIRAIVEGGFSYLREWLDQRLQHQDDILECLGREGICSHCSAVGLGRKRLDEQNLLQEEPLRMAANFLVGKQNWDTSDTIVEDVSSPVGPMGASQDITTLQPSKTPTVKSSASTKPTLPGSPEMESMTLPGCTPDIFADCIQLPPAERPTANLPQAPAHGWIMESPTSRPPKETSMELVASSPHSASSLVTEGLERDWQSQLMDIFDQLDLDRSGSIDSKEFAAVFQEVGLPPLEFLQVFTSVDGDNDKLVDRLEWLQMIETAAGGSNSEIDMLKTFVERIAHRQRTKGRIYTIDRSPKSMMIIRHDRPFRMVWDILMMFLLFYISLALPYSLGFGQPKTMEDIDRVFDFVFCFDVLLNLRTSYLDSNENIIVDGKKIGCKYLKSWFLLDFMSSVPFDLLTAGLMPSFQPAKLLKMGKIAKVMKLLKISKMLKGCEGSEFMIQIEEKSSSKASQTVVRLVQLMFLNLVLAHWLACFGAAVDNAHIEAYFEGLGVSPTGVQKWLAAVYWAMTTLSTVGYGDILPTTDSERIYAMFAMVVGGAFYGYIIGSVTSIVGDMDLNARAFSNRMDLVQSWLDSHNEMPKLLRRRVRKSYQLTLSTKSALEDSSIISELSPELRADMAFFIIHEHVRCNPMFKEVSNTAMAHLIMLLQTNHSNANECIVKVGDPGIAMYSIVDGCARYDKGSMWVPAGAEAPIQRFQKLTEGDSFGEEILFGLEECYGYTIIAITSCIFHSISEDGFKEQYRNMPEVHNQMYSSFLQSRSFV